MRRSPFGPLSLAFALTLAAGPVFPADAVSAGAPDAEFEQFDGTMIVETADHEQPAQVSTERFAAIRRTLSEPQPPPSASRGTAALNGSLRATYEPNVPSAVRTVVSAALTQWDAALGTNVPVVVHVGWECFNNPGVLGFAGPNHFYTSGSLPTANQYPVALANTFAGRDLNGGEAEIIMGLNAELAGSNSCGFATNEWYISTAAAVGGGQIDLYSVVLHELGHGLGFLGSAFQEGSQAPALEPTRYAYDAFVYTGETRLLSTANPNAQLTVDNLFFDLGGGHRTRLYSPATFENGSSFSHFDLSVMNQPGQLMTPALGNGQLRRVLDAPVLAVLHQQGWNVVPRAVAPINLAVTSGNGTATINWAHNLGAYGLPPVGYRIDVALGGAVVASTSVTGTATSATVGGLTNNTTYAVTVSPMDARGSAPGSQACFYLAQAPSAPQLVRSDGIGRSRTISWQAPANPGAGGAVSYTVQYRMIGGGWQDAGTTSALAITTGPLTPGVYQFRVLASNSFGAGAWGNSTIIGVSDSHIRPMPLDGQVSRLYSAYFVRAPEQGGFDFWLGQRAAGRPLTDVSANFAASTEFVTTYGSLANTAFVDLVYANVVGRPADSVGRAFWIDYLARGNSRGALMIGFSESAEYVARTGTASPTDAATGKIQRLYLAFFQREPDAAGQAFWVGRLGSGASLASIANGFVGSVEFQTAYSCLSDAQFVQLVYRNVLLREADAAGLSFWNARLAAGTSRGDVMTGFSESPEFISRTGSIS